MNKKQKARNKIGLRVGKGKQALLRDRSTALCQPMIDRIFFSSLNFYFYERGVFYLQRRASSLKRIDRREKKIKRAEKKGVSREYGSFHLLGLFGLYLYTLHAWLSTTTTYKYMHKEKKLLAIFGEGKKYIRLSVFL